ncbi:hypothetical protein [Kribbella qitaiheensis]|nr:hypothetical protein [Kribbella qitaiheensis]
MTVAVERGGFGGAWLVLDGEAEGDLVGYAALDEIRFVAGLQANCGLGCV